MIIIDLSQILYSSILASVRDYQELDEDFFRHITLNVIRSNYMKFKHSYGQLVIAIDDKKNWRKDIFPYYKAARATTRAKSTLDWKTIYTWMEMIQDELKTYFPYPVVKVENGEADDVIASLCLNIKEEILILSGDKDFGQLQKLPNIKQYDPLRKRWIEVSDPASFLKELIIRGDVSDGIPNIMSLDSCFVNKVRQKVMTKPRFEFFMMTDPKDYEEEHYRGFCRNGQLIDFAFIPNSLITEVGNCYESQLGKMGNLWTYFMSKKLPNLMESINDFR